MLLLLRVLGIIRSTLDRGGPFTEEEAEEEEAEEEEEEEEAEEEE